MRDGFSSPEKLPKFAFYFIVADCLLIVCFLWLEVWTGWDDTPFHELTAIALLLICGTAWTFTRRINYAWVQRQADSERQAAIVANQAKSRYLANVSHEIRSPLNTIYGYAQLIERNEGVSPKEAAKIIRRCAEHMTSLVEGLLDISQLENGVMRIKADVIQLDYFLDQIVAMMRPAATAKGLAFHYERSARLPEFVRIDQSRFRQVLINLLGNAIKYTDQGSVTLRVGYSGQTAKFEIIDTGPGIAEQDRNRIFDPYDRGGDDAALLQTGIGLGLSISRAIIDVLGGSLELDSTIGKGSCFRVSMMLSDVAGQGAPAKLSRTVAGYLGHRRSVLVVDDDPAQRQFVESLLGSLGFNVSAAESGEAAVALSQSTHFDLAILDISMPGISGWETAVQLRKSGSDDLRIVMLSANAQEFHRPAHETPVHDFFLIKPVEFGALVEAIGGLLNLSWHFASEVSSQPELVSDGELDAQGVAHVVRIRELVRIGYVRGIETEIKKLAALGGKAESLADELFAYLDQFDLTLIGRKLEGV